VLQDEGTFGGGGSTIGGGKDLGGFIPFEVKNPEGGLEVPLEAAVNSGGGLHSEKSKGNDIGSDAIPDRWSYDDATARSAVGGVLASPGLTLRWGGVGSDTRVLLAGGRGTGMSGVTAGAGV
jgi:hypothetical protein